MQTATELINGETREQQRRLYAIDPIIHGFNKKIAGMKELQPKRIIAFENGPIIEEGADESFIKAIDHLAQLRNDYISANYPLLQGEAWFVNYPE